MLSLVDKAENILTVKNIDLDNFGKLLDHTWNLKRQTGSAVSTNSIDDLYDKVLKDETTESATTLTDSVKLIE